MTARRERGAVLVVTALCLVVVLIIAALVIDLGKARAERRSAQTAADLAAAAAGFYLSGRGSPSVVAEAFGACRSAINSAQTNLQDFQPVLTESQLDSACTGFPADASSCDESTATVSTVVERGPYRLAISWPVPASAIADSRRSGGAGPNDGTTCERLAVAIHRSNTVYFAGVLGVESTQVDATAIVRADRSVPDSGGVAALVLLERVGCAVLQTSGGGSQGSGVVVQNAGSTRPANPGVIQVDSAGLIPPCGTNTNADGYAVFGTALPAAGGGGPSVLAEPAVNGSPGVIGIHALTPSINGRGGAVVETGIRPTPIPGGITSRQPVDDKYNSDAGGGTSIANLHDAGRTLVTATSTPSGYAAISGAQCSGLNTTDLVGPNAALATATQVFVDCADFQPGDLVLAAAQTAVFTGKVTVANNRFLSLPAASRVYIRGCRSGCTGSANYSIDVAGELRVNTVATGLTNVLCSARPGLGAGGTYGATAAVATYGGPVSVTGQARFCQTTIYLARSPSTTYSRSTMTSGGPAAAECSATLPCPTDTGGDAVISVTGGSGSVDWSAPNRYSTVPAPSEMAASPFEDLALWGEGSADSAIKGQGSSRTEGVFFLPNSSVTFTGQATQTQPLNAQFVARRLTVSGQGTLNLRPSAADVVITPIPGGIYLIR